MEQKAYIYQNGRGHHVALRKLSKAEMALNLYEYRGEVDLQKYINLMVGTVDLITTFREG